MNIINRIPLLEKVLSAVSRKDSCATLEITTVFPCVNSCKFCPQDKWRNAYKGKRRLTYDEFRRMLEKIPRNVRLDFSGFSEPFINHDSSLMMRYAYQNGYRVALFTTLVGFRPEDLDIIKDVRFSPCNIHVPDDANFRVSDEAKWLASFKLFTNNIRYDTAVYHLGNLSPGIKKEMAKLRSFPVLTRANNVSPGVAKPLPRHTGVIGCSASRNLFNQNVVMPNGDVYLCCMDWALQHRLGNLFEQSYEDLFRSEEYKKIVRGMQDVSVETICRYCERGGKQ